MFLGVIGVVFPVFWLMVAVVSRYRNWFRVICWLFMVTVGGSFLLVS